jgi:hypothetical protein
MKRQSYVKRSLALAMAGVMIVATLAIGRAEAGMIPTERVLAAGAPSDDRGRLADFVARAEVRQQMLALGVDPIEAKARIAALSDEEARRIAGRLDQLPSGQGVFETAIVASLLVFIILLVTDILGYTDVFPFVKRTVER